MKNKKNNLMYNEIASLPVDLFTLLHGLPVY